MVTERDGGKDHFRFVLDLHSHRDRIREELVKQEVSVVDEHPTTNDAREHPETRLDRTWGFGETVVYANHLYSLLCILVFAW